MFDNNYSDGRAAWIVRERLKGHSWWELVKILQTDRAYVQAIAENFVRRHTPDDREYEIDSKRARKALKNWALGEESNAGPTKA